ncbi:hypothetical protein ACIRL2_45115 [Embleya sp. NPDC127516]|uniref:hypothetical protein n=1 Tax=Embleya sp. NPDC127516 TaxID=3363990 RepID=UPI00380B06D3
MHRIDLHDLYATNSRHIPHPDGQSIALCLGSDPDDITIIWGSWDGREANTRRAETEPGIILCDISPAGNEYVALTPSTDVLTRYRSADDSPIIEIDYEALTTHPDADDPNDLPVWDQMCSYIDGDTIIASTSDLDDQWGRHRHWTLHSAEPSVPVEIAYPVPVTGVPTALGDGTWIARSDAEPNRVHLWARRMP